MSSIHKQPPKPYYFCAYYDPEGFRRFRSTGTDNVRVAKTICMNVEHAATLARDGKLSNEKGLKLIRETTANIKESHGELAGNRAHEVLKGYIEDFLRISGGELTSYTIATWFNTWLAGRTDASKATLIEYRRIIDLFLKFLGTRADRALTTLQSKQVEEFKLDLMKRVAPSTVNKAVKVIKASLNTAVAKRQLEFNPATHTESIEVEEGGRRPFTATELTALLAKADPEWKTMILLGYYTGQRLKDCASITLAKIHVADGTIELTTQKTKRRQVIPIHPALKEHLVGINKQAAKDSPLCPALFGKPSSWLSAQFYKQMVKAKIVGKRTHQKKEEGPGRDGRRDTSHVSFHSLRYNTTSALKSVGVSDSVAMDIVGHETASMSRNYTKIEESSKRAAINKLPDITR